jgi:hypothetical protein
VHLLDQIFWGTLNPLLRQLITLFFVVIRGDFNFLLPSKETSKIVSREEGEIKDPLKCLDE